MKIYFAIVQVNYTKRIQRAQEDNKGDNDYGALADLGFTYYKQGIITADTKIKIVDSNYVLF